MSHGVDSRLINIHIFFSRTLTDPFKYMPDFLPMSGRPRFGLDNLEYIFTSRDPEYINTINSSEPAAYPVPNYLSYRNRLSQPAGKSASPSVASSSTTTSNRSNVNYTRHLQPFRPPLASDPSSSCYNGPCTSSTVNLHPSSLPNPPFNTSGQLPTKLMTSASLPSSPLSPNAPTSLKFMMPPSSASERMATSDDHLPESGKDALKNLQSNTNATIVQSNSTGRLSTLDEKAHELDGGINGEISEDIHNYYNELRDRRQRSQGHLNEDDFEDSFSHKTETAV